MRSWLWWTAPLLLALATLACSDDESINPGETGPTGNAINRDAILGSIEDVRALITDNAESLDPMIIGDVDYSDGRLRVVLAESQNDLDTSGLQSTCREIMDAIALSDIAITVEKANGADSVECGTTS